MIQQRAGVEWGRHKALAETGKQGQCGQHSPQTPRATSEEMSLFSHSSPPMSPAPPTALLKGHVTAKLFCFVLLLLVDSKGKPGVWAGAGQTELVSSKKVSYLHPEGAATAHPRCEEQKHFSRPRLILAVWGRLCFFNLFHSYHLCKDITF